MSVEISDGREDANEEGKNIMIYYVWKWYSSHTLIWCDAMHPISALRFSVANVHMCWQLVLDVHAAQEMSVA